MKKWIPNQHGAWAMLISPLLVGAISVGTTPMHLALLVAWLSAYCFNFYLGLTIKAWRRTDRWSRYRKQQITYLLIAIICTTPIVIQHSDLIVLTPIFVVAFAINLISIRAKNERSWINDLVGVSLAVLVGGVSISLSDQSLNSSQLHMLFMQFLYFAGTIWYVKSMIRDRGSRGMLATSVGWHSAASILALIISPIYFAFFICTLLRSYVMPKFSVNPAMIGMIEILLTLILAAISIIAS